MGKIRILAVEDDPIISETIEIIIEELAYELIEVVDNGLEALRMHKAAIPDLVLMDIRINGKMDGIEVAEKMNNLRPTPIIFVSSLTDNATFQQARAVLPLAYVTKPINETNLQFAIELAISKLNPVSNDQRSWNQDVVTADHIFIKQEGKLTKILFKNILWIEVEGKYIKIITPDDAYFVKTALKELERKLPKSSFLRIHRNYMISIDYLEDVNLQKNIVTLHHHEIPIGSSYKENLINKINLLG